MKTCIICNKEKDVSCFSKQAKSRDGFYSYCKPCAKIKSKQWRQDNTESRKIYEKEYNQVHSAQIKVLAKAYRKSHRKYFYEKQKEFSKNNPAKLLLYDARKRAKKRGAPITITEADIVFPEFCPVLGIRLERNGLNNRDSSPSLDCVESELGYIPGNVEVISYRANRIKNDSSLTELKLLVKWLENRKSQDSSHVV